MDCQYCIFVQLCPSLYQFKRNSQSPYVLMCPIPICLISRFHYGLRGFRLLFHPGEIIPPGFVCWRLSRLTYLQELLGVQIMNAVSDCQVSQWHGTREKATSRSPAGHGVNEQQGTVWIFNIPAGCGCGVNEQQSTVWSEYGTWFLM